MSVVSRTAVEEAATRIAPYIKRTPVLTSNSLNELIGCELFFKCENFQKTGAFKARGAMNAVLNLGDDQTAVVTHSSGNHGAALAWAANICGRQAFVVVPEDASPYKRAAVERYGATIIDCDSTLESREEVLHEFQRNHDAIFIPPYDDRHVIAGQGTATLELLAQTDRLDQIWIPIGGGGLGSGTVVAANGDVPVIGAEPELAKDAHDSRLAGRRLPPLPPTTIADGLRSSLGELTFRILHEANVTIHLCSEAQIVQAMRLIWERLKLVVEPSAAVPLASMLANPGMATGRVGMILSGGNTEFPKK